jgi:16S rRNA (uracil1498-N3)-methyltransferase
MARRRFFVPGIHHQRAELAGEDAHHLTRVLRVERGQLYEISDNSQIWLAEVTEAHKNRVVFQVLNAVEPNPPAVHLTLLFSLIKFERIEWILEKGTELGVDTFIPVVADRSERGLDRAVPKRRARWEKILLESSQQCRRDRLPVLGDCLRFDEATRVEAGYRWILDEEGGTPIAAQHPRAPADTVAILTGPEGGWTDRERNCGWTRVSLGPSILRAETACLSAAAVVSALWTANVPSATPA